MVQHVPMAKKLAHETAMAEISDLGSTPHCINRFLIIDVGWKIKFTCNKMRYTRSK